MIVSNAATIVRLIWKASILSADGRAGEQLHDVIAERDHADGHENVVNECDAGGDAVGWLLEPQPEIR